jgi:hypothetical protein
MLPLSVDELLLEISRRGLRLNNLFQLADGRWQANVTDGEKYWEFGRANTAIMALQAALHISATSTPQLGVQPSKPQGPIGPGTINNLEF